MPTISKNDAAEKLADVVAGAGPNMLAEIHAELFPDRPAPSPLSGSDLARYVRDGLEAEEVIDLWNVLFPADRNVWFDEDMGEVHYNEEMVGYAD